MKNIDKIIKEELKKEKKNYLTESFRPLNDIKNNNFFSEQLLQTTLGLLDEGYGLEEINLIVEENFGERIENSAWGAIQKLLGTTDISGALGGGGLSMASEYALQWIMTDILGMKEGTAKFASAFFAGTNPMVLLKPFKTYEYCMQYMPSISASLLESIVKSAMGNPNKQWKQVVGAYGRNIAFEMIRDSNIDETAANKICDIIWHKESGSQSKGLTNKKNIDQTSKLASPNANKVNITNLSKQLAPSATKV